MIPRYLQDNFYHPTKTLGVTFTYVFFLLSFFKDRSCCAMVKQRNFLHVVSSSFDARFVKYYQFCSHYHKHCPINNIKEKCSRIGQNMLICLVHALYKWSLISDFIILFMWFWLLITIMNFANEWELINLYRF